MRKVLYLLIVILFISCSKSDEIIDDPLFVEYGLQDKFNNTENVIVNELLDSLIFFSGKLRNSDKIGLVVSDAKTKNKLIDIVPFDNNQLEIYQPYEGNTTVTIESIICYQAVQNATTITVFIKTTGYNSNSSISTPIDTYHYLFIKDNKIVKIHNVNNSSGDYPIMKWGQNFLLYMFTEYNKGYFLFSPLGEIITEVIYGRERYGTEYDFGTYDNYALNNLYQGDVINDFEAICVDILNIYGAYNINRMDLRKRSYIWDTPIDISKLDRPQFNDKKIISKSINHFTYELSYTEYSGNKGIMRFKVNLETGEVEYL